jgi:hypothetical protein
LETKVALGSFLVRASRIAWLFFSATFFSNREKVVEDTSAALAMDSEYVKALNRRAIAYEHLEKTGSGLQRMALPYNSIALG